jgi:hypothetical protein
MLQKNFQKTAKAKVQNYEIELNLMKLFNSVIYAECQKITPLKCVRLSWVPQISDYAGCLYDKCRGAILQNQVNCYGDILRQNKQVAM